jgi:hypothetical protein
MVQLLLRLGGAAYRQRRDTVPMAPPSFTGVQPVAPDRHLKLEEEKGNGR